MKRSARVTKAKPPSAARHFTALIARMTVRYPWRVTQLFLCCMFTVAFLVGLQKAEQIVVDRAFPGFGRPGDAEVLAYVMVGLGVALLIASLAALRQTYLTAYLSGRTIRDLRLDAFGHLQYLRMGNLERMQQGDISSRITADLAIVEWALSTLLGQGLQLVLTLIAAAATVFWLDWRLGLVSLLVLPIFIPVGFLMGRPTARASLQRQSDLGAVATDLQENLAGQDVVRAYSLERHSIGGFTTLIDRLLRSSIRVTFLSSIYGLSTNTLASVVQMATIGIGGWLVIQGELTLGTLIAFLGLLGLMITPVQNIAGLVQIVQQASGAIARVDELLALPRDNIERGVPAAPVRGSVEFDDVSFSYRPGAPALRGVSLRIPAGSRFAIVGPSGSGKSTLIRLLLGFDEPEAGTLRIDGIESTRLNRQSLRHQLAVVPQDDFLFNLSIRDNIRLGRLDATDSDLNAAVTGAELGSVIEQLPAGLDTYAGERGGQLSGGQRQRVALARALIRQPSVLVLDEATSALDPQTEAAIHAAIARLDRSVTVVFVTHRIASVQNADWIAVLDAGRVAEEGTHGALLTLDGLYARLWEAQQHRHATNRLAESASTQHRSQEIYETQPANAQRR